MVSYQTQQERLRRSAAAVDSPIGTLAGFRQWFGELADADETLVEPIPFDAMRGWTFQPGTQNLVHHSGRFFAVEGVQVRMPGRSVAQWAQPILNQPEIGILGILAKEFDGILHFLMQAKNEPGNQGGVQLSPTVQATRSNYTRVHQGKPVPYLEYFRHLDRHTVLADVRHSEQGSWFYRKRNRNMIVEIPPQDHIQVREGFRWLTLGQLHRLLAEEDVLNMDARSVLACLPYSALDPDDAAALPCDGRPPAGLHSTTDILSWVTGIRSEREVLTDLVPLSQVPQWSRSADRISHDTGRFFSIMAVDVRSTGREVAHWTQPLLAPHGQGVVAFLLADFDKVPHVLVHARADPGYTDVVELAPTVQCTPSNYDHLPEEAAPPFLEQVLRAPAERVLFDTALSEEGGRFYHALNRYLLVEADPADVPAETPDHRWIAVHQLVGLLRHSHYLNVEARTLVACLNGLALHPETTSFAPTEDPQCGR